MEGFSLHPNVYGCGGTTGLIRTLEQIWVRDHTTPGQGTFYIVSGFGNYNGGVRFFPTFEEHIRHGGKVVSFFAGSTSQRLTSRQLVEQMLLIGAEVNIVNRKRLLHAKCYGASTQRGERLVVTSGNFTGPGMSQNVEAALILDTESIKRIGFSWNDVIDSLLNQTWDRHQPALDDLTAPGWRLLYDEYARDIVLDESEESTMLLVLGHADTARIRAQPGANAGKGTQYFWLSKDCYGFFPPLTIRNQKGEKATFSCLINMAYIELGVIDPGCRVTFEAENNLDFRLGTGPLRYSQLAAENDLAVITRTGEVDYEMRLVRSGTPEYGRLIPFATTFIGHQGKRYGFIDNSTCGELLGIRFPTTAGLEQLRPRR